MKLEGKTVLLTGANGGIGSSLAHELAAGGCALILVGRDEISLARLRQVLPFSSRHRVVVSDLQSDSGVQSLVAYCRQLSGGLDILINNAGMSDFSFVSTSDKEVTRALIELNLTVPVTLTAALLPDLLKQPEAAVINVGSVFGSIGYPGFAVYGASKAGLRTFSEGLRRELADSTVRVLYAAPRATRTPMNSSRVVAMNQELGNTMDTPETVAAAIVNRIKAGRWSALTLGWPERFFVWLNAVVPRLTDAALRRQLPRIRQFARVPAANKTLPAAQSVDVSECMLKKSVSDREAV